MALGFTSLSHWLRGAKTDERFVSAAHSSSDLPSLLRTPDSPKLPSMRRVKKKWQSREERRMGIDWEYDMVIVPSNNGYLSGSESEDSDWSIGWLEPHASDFQSNSSDQENSFAVLVPCYVRGMCEKTGKLNNFVIGTDHTAVQQNEFSSACKHSIVAIRQTEVKESFVTFPDVSRSFEGMDCDVID